MQRGPLISVIVPVYRTEKYLKKCLDSILKQTYENIEVVIVNDASDDDCEYIIKQYIQKYENVKYVRHSKNRGLFKARVSGAEEATGDYIAFVDSDDYISLDFYRVLIKKALDTDSDIVVCNTVFEDVDGSQTVRQLYRLCFEKDELAGEEIRNRFFSQEGYCFSWHTVWNKIYSKKLWDKCFEYYKKLDQHIIMTEDIAFSSLLLYNAEKLTCEYSASYFYCKHPDASTDAENIKFSKFEKNMHDLKCVFDFVESYLTKEGASDDIKKAFLEFRKKYSRMYRSLQEYKFPGDRKAKEMVNKFLPGYYKPQNKDEFCFDVVNADFAQGLDYAKKIMLDPQIRYVSFDIFDTLILRRVYNPADIFIFLNYEFDKLTAGKYSIPFRTMREISEKKAREEFKGKCEDVTLKEIYDTMYSAFSVEKDIVYKMYELEKEYEYRFCTVRKIGKELYDFAYDIGKKIIIISDMYLEYDTVLNVLQKNGFDKHEALFLSSKERCLKYSGMLFRKALRQINCRPQAVLHIGDTWNTDISAAERLGIKTFFLPKAKESFENIINDIKTNDCAWVDKYIAGPFSDGGTARKSVGYRLMLSMVANKFFDNPFPCLNKKSDFNCDPYFIGYYAVGMHCLGLAKWMHDIAVQNKYSCIYFLARDGYLPMKIFEIYSKAFANQIKCKYLHASRKLTLPFTIEDKNDLYDLPIEKNSHTPLSVCNLLSFCIKNEAESFEADLLNNRFVPDKTFKNDMEFYRLIDFIAQNRFDPQKLKQKKDILKKYYSCIEDNSIVFDMGYSGRIQSAICRAAGKRVDAFFVHTDHDRCEYFQNKCGFKVYSFYDSIPASSDVMREYMLSAIEPACSDIELSDDGNCRCVYDKDDISYPEKFVVRNIQRGAVEFADDFISLFSDKTDEIDFVPQEVSYPFEYFLRFGKYEDRKIFNLCSLEDRCYGNIVSVNAETIFNNQLCDVTPYQLPVDFYDLKKISLDIHSDEYPAAEEKDVSDNEPQDSSKFAAMFLDKIERNDSLADKLLKCGSNTSNIVLWQALQEMINPVTIKNWYINHPGDFDEEEYNIYLTTSLNQIRENSDLTYLDKLLARMNGKPLLPVGIGFSCDREKSDFALDVNSQKTLCAIAERCKSVGAAGEYAAELLSGFGVKNVRIIGTPSVYTNLKDITDMNNADVAELRSVAASFKPFYGVFTEKEKQLLKYFADNKFKLIETTNLKLERASVRNDELFAYLSEYAKTKNIYFTAKEWKKNIRGIDFAIGMVFQNNVMALSEKIPALFICYETSDKDICRFLGLPYIDVESFDPQKSIYHYYTLADYSSFKSKFEQNFAAYMDFLKENGVTLPQIKNRIIEK